MTGRLLNVQNLPPGCVLPELRVNPNSAPGGTWDESKQRLTFERLVRMMRSAATDPPRGHKIAGRTATIRGFIPKERLGSGKRVFAMPLHASNTDDEGRQAGDWRSPLKTATAYPPPVVDSVCPC
jgi:hypothetical protein